MVTKTTGWPPVRDVATNCCPSYMFRWLGLVPTAEPPEPEMKAPPWMKTITGNVPPPCGVIWGVQTLR